FITQTVECRTKAQNKRAQSFGIAAQVRGHFRIGSKYQAEWRTMWRKRIFELAFGSSIMLAPIIRAIDCRIRSDAGNRIGKRKRRWRRKRGIILVGACVN